MSNRLNFTPWYGMAQFRCLAQNHRLPGIEPLPSPGIVVNKWLKRTTSRVSGVVVPWCIGPSLLPSERNNRNFKSKLNIDVIQLRECKGQDIVYYSARVDLLSWHKTTTQEKSDRLPKEHITDCILSTFTLNMIFE